jgi:ABC-type phosphate transport system substrate-binding protein
MISSITKKRVACGLIAASLGASLMVGSASADPAQYNAFVGVGSDTTQDVLNALAGKSNGLLFTPVQSSAATGSRQLISFDATPPAGAADNCITPKLGVATFTRPNGSSAGRRALSRAIDGTGYGSAATCALADVSGSIDFARSSALTAGGTALTYIPFGRDGMSFAYYRANGAPVTTLTQQQLNTLFTVGPQTIGGVRIVGCGIQTGSGTYQFWNSVTGASVAQEDAATALCNGLNVNGVGGRAQESDGPDLKLRGDAIAALPGETNTQVVIGFSAGQFIARSNGVASPAPGPGVGIGSVSDNGLGANLGSPITGTAPTLAPNPTFYADNRFGRLVYNVFPTSIVTGPGNNDLKSLFVDQAAIAGNEATLCAATATINTFGFLTAPNCGALGITGPLLSGQL